ncbi:hypothetical protein [Enhygromyxa salina]|uniref:Outer membrane protein beta-barrel domain-containing protein n=1 Tax=Enhygromyxa salina TaxID=215803 RepID=A0A2S9XKZ6_9BACT|nr:hypothetical protein [Enhygromyxa salina]PRP93554.1 hypothetical protein ENSA7_79820 [Enhygromyxa salina]
MIALALVHSVALLALSPAPESAPAPAPEPAPGGFGSVESITTDSNVHGLPPPELEDDDDDGPRHEFSARAEAGYAQTNLGNADGLDHHGLFLRLHVAVYPWVSKSRRVAGGIGLLYSYAGTNRRSLPDSVELDASKAQQQQIMVSDVLLVRAHPEWFSIEPAAMIGLGFYSNAKVFAADRAAVIRKDEYAFVAGGSLALCTAWDIACVTGGASVLVAVETVGTQAPTLDARVIHPWGWHVGVGVDILRIMARANRTAA